MSALCALDSPTVVFRLLYFLFVVDSAHIRRMTRDFICTFCHMKDFMFRAINSGSLPGTWPTTINIELQ